MASLPGEPIREGNPVFFFSAGAGRGRPFTAVRDFVAAIRAELPASVEKSGAWRRRTNVVLKLAAGRILFVRRELARGSEPGAGLTTDTALHTGPSRVWSLRCAIAPQAPASPA